eukprot:COSAG06_NODE_32647_length_503_cov_2.538462_1_plen_108_part_01
MQETYVYCPCLHIALSPQGHFAPAAGGSWAAGPNGDIFAAEKALLRTMMPLLLPRLAAAAALVALARAQHQPSPAISPGCDSEDELLGNLRWLRDACAQAGEQFDDDD